jgi:hypothetical protein
MPIVLLFSLLLVSFGCATAASDFDYNVAAVTEDSGPIPLRRTHDGMKPPRHDMRGLLLIPVRFGTHDEQCILDTGATASYVVATEFFKTLPMAGRAWVTGVGGRWEAAFRVRSPETRIGDRIYKDQTFTLSDPEQAMIRGVNCLIGMNFLVGSTLHFDFQHDRFEMLRTIPPGVPFQPLTLTRTGSIEIPVTLAGNAVLGTWDSGNELTAVDPSVVESQPAQFHYLRTLAGAGVDSLGRRFDTKIYGLDHLEFGGRHIDNTLVQAVGLGVASNIHPPVLLGMDLLERYEWYFDLVQRRWAIR